MVPGYPERPPETSQTIHWWMQKLYRNKLFFVLWDMIKFFWCRIKNLINVWLPMLPLLPPALSPQMFNESLLIFNVFRWFSIIISYSKWVLKESQSFQWFSINFNDFQRFSIIFNVNQWALLIFNDLQWSSMIFSNLSQGSEKQKWILVCFMLG